MLEQDAVAGVDAVGLAVVDRRVVREQLGDGVGAARPQRRVLVLRRRRRAEVPAKLAELREALKTRGADWSAPLLPHWVLAFGRLIEDGAWQVREQACVLLDLFAQQLRRQLHQLLRPRPALHQR